MSPIPVPVAGDSGGPAITTPDGGVAPIIINADTVLHANTDALRTTAGFVRSQSNRMVEMNIMMKQTLDAVVAGLGDKPQLEGKWSDVLSDKYIEVSGHLLMVQERVHTMGEALDQAAEIFDEADQKGESSVADAPSGPAPSGPSAVIR